MIMQMHRAVYANDVPQLRRFMSLRPLGLKQRDHHGNTPLLLALKLARVEMAWLLIRGGAELDVPSDGSFHLLVSAVVMWASYRARCLDLNPALLLRSHLYHFEIGVFTPSPLLGCCVRTAMVC